LQAVGWDNGGSLAIAAMFFESHRMKRAISIVCLIGAGGPSLHRTFRCRGRNRIEGAKLDVRAPGDLMIVL